MRKPRPTARDRERALGRMATPLTPGRPDALAGRQLSLAEIDPIPALKARFLTPANDHLRVYRLGDCSVIVTRELGEWHLSIAHPSRYPTWDEIAQARYRILPGDIWMAMYLPPEEDYVNIHRFCFQLCQCPPRDD